jgi:PAS domain S-box-containing protein
MPMGDDRFRSNAVEDPRLAPYAAGPQPAWLWSVDGSSVLWCNDAGAIALGIDDPRLREKSCSPADPHRRQVAQLARRLASNGATRLERLRGFGARLGQLATCACARFETRDGEAAILVVAVDVSIRVASPVVPPAIALTPQTHEPGDAIPAEQAVDAAPVEALSPHAQSDDASPDIASPEAALPAAPPEEPAPAIAEPEASKPLRFVWQIDAADRFSLASDEFLRIAGERTATLLGRAWREVTEALGLDPHGRLHQAIAGRETFSGIDAEWPLARHGRGRIELSGMPVFDSARNFAGYRGFGIYRPTAAPSADPGAAPADDAPIEQPPSDIFEQSNPAATPAAPESPSQRETDTVEPPQNVVLFPLANDTRMPSLSAVENHAFDEIARRLTQNFDDKPQEEPVRTEPDTSAEPVPPHEEELANHATQTEQPAWLTPAAAPPRGDSATDRMLLDLMPSGILIYRLDRLLYANRAFLAQTGYDNLHALQEAGGLDALYVEPGPASTSSTSDEGMPLTIAPPGRDRPASDARLFSILWDGETAHALILHGAQATPQAAPAPEPEPPPQPVAAAQPADNALEAILETATDGIILFDRSGAITSANRSAEALFGIGAEEFRTLNFADLFATESQRIVLDYFESLDAPIAASPLDHGREVLGRERGGGFISLSMTMGRIGDDRERFFAVFRDLSQLKKNESDLLNAHRKADRATAAKTDALAGISHEIRGPLNTIIGFANIMIEERFGDLGNERYAEYLRDIRASGERAVAILDDIVNISSIETGKVDLRLVSQNLNEMVEQCVGVLQPQANRERVIIRTSLAHALPQVMADTQALRQITMNVVTSSIRFSRAGGQVIVSTAPGENGGAVLRVRDAGRSSSDAELSSAMSSHRAAADRSAIDLSLARALAEANRAQFHIRTTDNSGTLIEVVFANVRALAG